MNRRSTKLTETQIFHHAARLFILKSWVKKSLRGIKGILRGHGPEYPASVGVHVEMPIDGKPKVFAVMVRDITESTEFAQQIKEVDAYRGDLLSKSKASAAWFRSLNSTNKRKNLDRTRCAKK